MKTSSSVQGSFDLGSPAEKWELDSAKRELDELFNRAGQYRLSKSYFDLLRFVGRFRNYSPFNAMLAHIQRPGARYVATVKVWQEKYGRCIKTGRNPIVLLRPMGPIMFVFDVSDTEPLEGAPELPPQVTDPFRVRNGSVNMEFEKTVENAKRDGVRVTWHEAGSQLGGSIRTSSGHGYQRIEAQLGPITQIIDMPIHYDVHLNFKSSKETSYRTLAHELAHLYCGHLGTVNPKWWPDRRGLNLQTREFEAESVSYLVCARLGIQSPSEEYLSGYLQNKMHVPDISLHCVLKAGLQIESMAKRKLKQRKETLEELG